MKDDWSLSPFELWLFFGIGFGATMAVWSGIIEHHNLPASWWGSAVIFAFFGGLKVMFEADESQ